MFPYSRILEILLLISTEVVAFQQVPAFHRQIKTTLRSSVGDKPPGGGGGRQKGGDRLGDFLDPLSGGQSADESEDFRSDESLPISFNPESTDADDDMTNDVPAEKDTVPEVSEEEELVMENDTETIDAGDLGEIEVIGVDDEGNLIARQVEEKKGPTGDDFFQLEAMDKIKNNPYLKVVSSLTPNELISKFMKEEPVRVQNAVRGTILSLIGSLPKMAFDTTTVTTGARLASLMFQLQMTGYMFKNAEYRLSVAQSLGLSPLAPMSPETTAYLLEGRH